MRGVCDNLPHATLDPALRILHFEEPLMTRVPVIPFIALLLAGFLMSSFPAVDAQDKDPKSAKKEGVVALLSK